MIISPLFDDDTTPKVRAADVPCKSCKGTGGLAPGNRAERRKLKHLAGGRSGARWRCPDCQGSGKIRLRELGPALPAAQD